jgi:hypothetical protein
MTQDIVEGEGALDEAWSRFARSIETLGRRFVAARTDVDARDRADGYRHLAHLVQDALAWCLGADPLFPRWIHLNDTAEIADNRFARIDPGESYRITGHVASLFDINLSLHADFNFLGRREVWGDLGLAELATGPDGSIEVILSATPHPGNWIAIPSEARFVQLREFYYDWNRDSPGRFEIVRIGSEGQAPARPEPDEVARQIDKAGQWVAGYLETHDDMIERRYPKTRNIVTRPVSAAGGNRNLRYGFLRFAIAQGEALRIAFPAPRARAWTLQWLTDPWFENPDLANRATSISGGEAAVGADGIVQIVMSGQDPGVANWIDIGGYTRGVAVLRWFWCDSDDPIETQAGPIDEVVAGLPRIDAAERQAQQARRRALFARRNR